MTLFGWDASHYDGTLSTAILSRAKAEGIAFFTHKIGEGTSYDDPGDATALACAKAAGIEFIGGYFVPRSVGTVAAQVSYLLALADRDEPWWRNFPGWFWQVDLERWSYDDVPASVGIAFAQELQRRTGRWVILYASHGQYSNLLTAWSGPLWNAHYTSGAAGGVAAMYPGDNWKPTSGGFVGGWGSYSGREPTILQYTSSATIAGLTTCDANAFRGTAADLRRMIEGTNVEINDVVPAAATSDVPNRTLNQVLGDLWYDTHIAGNGQLKKLDTLLSATSNVLAAVNLVSLSGVTVTQEMLNAAVLAAMKDPAVLTGIGAAIAGHLKVT